MPAPLRPRWLQELRRLLGRLERRTLSARLSRALARSVPGPSAGLSASGATGSACSPNTAPAPGSSSARGRARRPWQQVRRRRLPPRGFAPIPSSEAPAPGRRCWMRSISVCCAQKNSGAPRHAADTDILLACNRNRAPKQIFGRVARLAAPIGAGSASKRTRGRADRGRRAAANIGKIAVRRDHRQPPAGRDDERDAIRRRTLIGERNIAGARRSRAWPADARRPRALGRRRLSRWATRAPRSRSERGSWPSATPRGDGVRPAVPAPAPRRRRAWSRSALRRSAVDPADGRDARRRAQQRREPPARPSPLEPARNSLTSANTVSPTASRLATESLSSVSFSPSA